MSDFYNEAPKKSNAGFRFGLIGAVVAISVNLALMLIYGGDTKGDLLAWMAQLLIYIFIPRSAAEAQYRENQLRGDFEYLRGVKAAGLGAGLTASVLVWIYIIIRSITRDAFGVFIFIEPFSFACLMAIDIALAMAIGSWGGSAIAKKYGGETPY